MAHEIEANYIAEWENKDGQCWRCTSFNVETGFCSEAQSQVSAEGHCDFFQAKED
jgi:hypothetical protein